jgi:hypothetical protein
MILLALKGEVSIVRQKRSNALGDSKEAYYQARTKSLGCT